MLKALSIFGNVAFVHFLGISLIACFALIADFLMGTAIKEHLFTTPWGVWICNLCGVAMMAWAVQDGQFVWDVKPSHWSIKVLQDHRRSRLARSSRDDNKPQ